MKMPCGRVIALGCWLIGSAMAQARIGGTEKQCEERYGKPTATPNGDKSKWMYNKGDMVILAHFHEERCDYIMFSKIDRATAGKAEISENEQELLLKANGGGKEWEKVQGIMGIEFRTKDGALHAQYSTFDRSIMIITREAVKRHEDEKKAEEEKKLKGF